MATMTENGPVTASEQEHADLAKVFALLALADFPRPNGAEGTAPGLALVGPDGQRVSVPPSVVRVLRQVVTQLVHGHSVSVVGTPRELTTQQAAELLHVSRPFLVEQLLEKGEIPFVMVGTHRRIALEDVLAYQRRRKAERKQALARLSQLSQEYGLYRE
jgi:excisionase family DNA binding protein